MIDNQPIRPEFQVHILNEGGIIKAKALAAKYSELIDFMEAIGMCLPSRELSIAKTKLEEACFFAKKAMAVNPINQKQDNWPG